MCSEITSARSGEEVTLKGWAEDIRNLGGIVFVVLRDRSGTVQITASRRNSEEAIFSRLSGISRESVLSVTGRVNISEKAQRGVEVLAMEVEVLSAAAAPLPMGVIDRVNVDHETRLDNRFMDMRRSERSSVFRMRALLCSNLRKELEAENFIEVNTPKIVAEGAEGGATLFSVDYFGRKAFLAQSPQLYKQMLMATSLERVYEMAPAYRAEPFDTVRHTSEFISFDAELSFIDGMEDVLQMLEKLVCGAMKNTVELGQWRDISPPEIPRRPFPRLTYSQCLNMLSSEGREIMDGADIDTEAERIIGAQMKGRGYSMYFITHYPESIKPFYIMADGERSLSFDLEYKGTEMVSGGQREHRYDRLVERMKLKGLNPRGFEFYLKPFMYGMPPHGGWGMGLDRFAAAFLSLGNIREAILFPRDRTRLVP